MCVLVGEVNDIEKNLNTFMKILPVLAMEAETSLANKQMTEKDVLKESIQPPKPVSFSQRMLC